MAMMAPVVMGVLKGRKEESHLDAGGLANMLQGQKDNIARAMPAGLGSMLTSALPSFSGIADTARAAVGTAADATRRTAYAATSAASTGSRWLIPLLLLAGAGLLWWLIARSNAPRTVTPALPSTPAVTPSVRDTASAALTKVSDSVTDVYKSITGTLTGITDSATAEEAKPKLEDALTRLDTLKRDVAGLPSSVTTSINSVIKNAAPAVNAQLDRVKSLAGLSDPVRRLVDEIGARITSLGS
jgi:hypothetical protein